MPVRHPLAEGYDMLAVPTDPGHRDAGAQLGAGVFAPASATSVHLVYPAGGAEAANLRSFIDLAVPWLRKELAFGGA